MELGRVHQLFIDKRAASGFSTDERQAGALRDYARAVRACSTVCGANAEIPEGCRANAEP